MLVCSGHHREAFLPAYPGRFTGRIVHSSAYKHPDPFRGRGVLVVGAGNSAAEIAVDVARLAARAARSMCEGTYVIPKLMFGQAVDVVYAFWAASSMITAGLGSFPSRDVGQDPFARCRQ